MQDGNTSICLSSLSSLILYRIMLKRCLIRSYSHCHVIRKSPWSRRIQFVQLCSALRGDMRPDYFLQLGLSRPSRPLPLVNASLSKAILLLTTRAILELLA